MAKAKRQQKSSTNPVTKDLKIEINRLVEKWLTKAIKKIDFLEKALGKLKVLKQKSIKVKRSKKAKRSTQKKMDV